jgi:hypothetical protein
LGLKLWGKFPGKPVSGEKRRKKGGRKKGERKNLEDRTCLTFCYIESKTYEVNEVSSLDDEVIELPRINRARF